MKLYSQKYTTALLSLCALFTACRDEVSDVTDPNAGKTPIDLSVQLTGEKQSVTRAITIQPNETSKYRAFKNSTSLYMIMKCDDLSDANRAAKYTRTYGLAGKVSDPADGSYSNVDFTREGGIFIRYWDDAYARESAISLYAICMPGCNGGDNDLSGDGYKPSGSVSLGGETVFQNIPWSTNVMTTVLPDWDLPTDQTTTNCLIFNDLCYSNNISKYTINEVETDARLKFDTSTKKFKGGNLVFYHATSKITFVIKKDKGYTSEESFSFTDGTIKLTGFNRKISGFDLATGDFISGGGYTVGEISKMSIDNTEKVDGSDYTVRGLVFPGTDLTEDTEAAKNAVSFAINNNKYVISRQKLYNAISEADRNTYLENGKKLKAGVHYIFTFTISKTAVNNITAELVDWETITADNLKPDNARIKLDLWDPDGKKLDSGVDFYRGLNLYPGQDINDDWVSYEDVNWENTYNWQKIQYEKANAQYEDDKWTTEWYWESNRHFYNFRSVIPSDYEVDGNIKPSPNPTLSLAADSAQKYIDVKWGAPFKNTSEKLTYSTSKGFDGKDAEDTANPIKHQIYQAIGPTNDPIKIISFHMMSEVTVNITTSDDDDKVLFGDGSATSITKIELRGCYQAGKVQLGDGLVSTTGEKKNIYLSEDLYKKSDTDKKLSVIYGVIPQSLTGTELCITTADGNQYLVDLASVTIPATNANPSNYNLANPYKIVDGKCTINYWYPGYRYTYNLKLLKTGIADLRATIVNWETVDVDEVITIK